MLCAQPARRPCCEITHTPLSSARPVSGTRRGSPDFAPIVSSSTTNDERMPSRSSVATSGFAIMRPTRRSNLNLRSALRDSVVPMVNEVNRMIAQIQAHRSVLGVLDHHQWHARLMAGPPETLYARDGDAHLAYQVIGDHKSDLLFVPTGMFPIDLLWDDPTVAGQLHRLASFSRLILTDLLGAGSSDAIPINERPAMQSWTDGLLAVLDEVGSERASIFAMAG